MPSTLDELDVIEKDPLQYEKEIRQKDVPEVVDTEAKESGTPKVEETRRYVLYFCFVFMLKNSCMVNVTRQFVVVCPKCTCEYSNIHFLIPS